MDAGPNWVAPRMAAHTKQSAQTDRETYIDNEEQPQHSNEKPPMGTETAAAPVAPIAGQVTSAVATGVNAGDLKMEDANPAKVRKEDDGSSPKEETDIDAKRKRGDEASKGEEGTDKVTPPSSSTATAPPAKKSKKGSSGKKK